MASKSSQPVYIPNETIEGVEKWLQTPQGIKTSLTDPRKGINFILTKFLSEQD